MSSTDSFGHKAAKGAVWATADRFGTMGIQFMVNLILARLLLPEDFGIIGMIAIFVAVSQTLVDGGFTSALIQKKEPTQTDYSTVFFWNTGLSVVLYLILFVSAPFIADFYHNPQLSPVVRIIGLTLIINAVTAILLTRLRKSLSFSTIAATNILSYIISGAIAITLAYAGWGVWSLVAMQISTGVLATVIFSIITRWYPSFEFSKDSFRALFSFGGYILAANILQTACQNLQGLIIGRKFSATQMGYYSQAYKLDQVTSYSIPQIIVQVMYPVYSSIQDDKERLQAMLLMNVRVISFIIFPMLGLLMVTSEPIIGLLYGEKWLACAPYFSIICVGGLFLCLTNVNFYAVAAVGRSRHLFLWSFYKWGFLMAALFIGAIFGMKGILWGMVLSNINIYIVNATLAHRFIGLRLFRQLLSLIPAFIALAAAIASAYFISQTFPTINISLPIAAFIAVYLIISAILNRKSISDTIALVKRILKK